MIVLVHHAEAVDTIIDPQRPLSESGRQQASRLAGELAARGLKPDAVWHSGKLRARQTAEAVWRVCNPLAEFSATRGLQPSDPPHWIEGRLVGETRHIVVVGHLPNLPKLAQLMTTGVPGDAFDFPVHGAVAFEEQTGRWAEQWRIGLTT
jgi:phosphohistidine phosphatase